MRFVLALSMLATAAYAEDVPLTGYVRGMDGAGMAGVAVSAKAPGSTITTSVYTDKSGLYSFSPMPTGRWETRSRKSKPYAISRGANQVIR